MGRIGGNAGLYLRDTFNFNIMSDLRSSNSALFDSVFVEIENPHGKNLIIGRVYRPPSANLHAFLESFQQLLDRVTRDNKMCYIMGDFNLDLLNTDLHSATNEFINALFSHFLYLLISRPTRLTSYSATLIDNLLILIFLPRVTMDSLLMICPTIYQSSHSVTLMLILQKLSLRKVLPFATSLVRILKHLRTFCVNYCGWISSVGRALDCRAVGCGFDSRGRTNTQGLKITEK